MTRCSRRWLSVLDSFHVMGSATLVWSLEIIVIRKRQWRQPCSPALLAQRFARSLQPYGASSNGIVLHGCVGRFAGVWHIHHTANVVPGVIVSEAGRREAGQLPHVAWSLCRSHVGHPTDMDHTVTSPLQQHRSLSPEESRFRYQSTA